MAEKLTNCDFGVAVARIGSRCMGWATDCLDPADWRDREIGIETVQRFTAEIRDRLDYLEERARRGLADQDGR